MSDLPIKAPAAFMAGDTVEWLQDVGDYTVADGYTLKVVFVQDDDKQTITSSTAEGDYTKVSISAEASAAFIAGTYKWFAIVDDDTNRHTVDEGEIEVTANLLDDGALGFEFRSWARRAIEALENTMAGKASSDQLSMQVNGRLIQRMTYSELIKAHRYLSMLVESESDTDAQAKGENLGGVIRVRFMR